MGETIETQFKLGEEVYAVHLYRNERTPRWGTFGPFTISQIVVAWDNDSGATKIREEYYLDGTSADPFEVFTPSQLFRSCDKALGWAKIKNEEYNSKRKEVMWRTTSRS